MFATCDYPHVTGHLIGDPVEMAAGTLDVFVRRLQRGADLDPADCAALRRSVVRVADFDGDLDLIREGEQPSFVHVMLEGFACRYKVLPDGQRQILAWLLPGDICDLHVTILDRMDHSTRTLTPSRIAFIPKAAVSELAHSSAALSKALQWVSLVDEAVLQEWLAGAGRRSADLRIAHLLCELLARLHAVGLGEERAIDLPLTQAELADSAGLSTVHVNRTLQDLRQRGFLAWQSHRIVVIDPKGLAELCGFTSDYLHLRQPLALPPNPMGAPRAGRDGAVGAAPSEARVFEPWLR